MSFPAETLPQPEPSPRPVETVVAPPNVDAELVERVRSGDIKAFELLFRTHWQPLADFALQYVGSRDAAEDLVQEIFRRLWERRASWTVQLTPRSYLYTAVRNDALNVLRHERIVEKSENEILWQEGDWVPGIGRGAATPTDARVLDDEIAAALAQAVEALPRRARQAYTLYHDHELTYAEVAEVIGITGKAVEGLLWRAHRALRRALQHVRE